MKRVHRGDGEGAEERTPGRAAHATLCCAALGLGGAWAGCPCHFYPRGFCGCGWIFHRASSARVENPCHEWALGGCVMRGRVRSRGGGGGRRWGGARFLRRGR